jgi:hypothetical protein
MNPLAAAGPQGLIAICALIWVKWARAATSGRIMYVVLPVATAGVAIWFLSSSASFAELTARWRDAEWDASATTLMYAFAAATFAGQFVDVVMPTRSSEPLKVFETRRDLEQQTRLLVVIVGVITAVRVFA